MKPLCHDAWAGHSKINTSYIRQQIFASRMLEWLCVLLGLFCDNYKTLILELVILDMVFYSEPLADFASVLVIFHDAFNITECI